MLRKMNLETAAPVATLIKVENEGTYAYMHFQQLGSYSIWWLVTLLIFA